MERLHIAVLQCEVCRQPVVPCNDDADSDTFECPRCEDCVYCSAECMERDRPRFRAKQCAHTARANEHAATLLDVQLYDQQGWHGHQTPADPDKGSAFLRARVPGMCTICGKASAARELQFTSRTSKSMTPGGRPLLVGLYCCAQPECLREANRLQARRLTELTPDHAQVYRSCTACGRMSTDKLKKCGRCLGVYYCDAACQLTHWTAHKKTCGKAPPPRDGFPMK
jgi:hypothetical protein